MSLETASPVIQRSSLALTMRRLVRDPASLAAFCFIVLTVIFAFSAPLIASATGHSPIEQHRETGLSPMGLPVAPNGEFVFGTDHLGRDVLVRLAYGASVSLTVGILAALAAAVVGVTVGMVAGYFGGWIDTVLSRAMDLVMSVPFLLCALALVSVFGPSLSLSIGVIVFFSWTTMGRVIRGQVISLRRQEFVEASRSLGAGPLSIMFVDILPNLSVPIIIYTTMMIPGSIVFEATLSFLGMGIVPPAPSWGGMLADAAANSIYLVAWWLVLIPGLALLLTTLAFNILGDGLRDALDPKGRLVARKSEAKAMIRFLAGRVLFGALVLFALSLFVFFLFFIAPGDPARMIAGDKATEKQLIQIRTNLGLDRPITEQYVRFVGNALHGDLGFSYRNQQPVAKLIINRLPPTLSLVIGGVIVWLAVGIPIGIMSARHAGGLRDRMGQGFILIGLSFPTFVLGMTSLYLFYFLPRQAGFTLLPAGGFKPFLPNPAVWAWHLILPWSTLALTTAAVYARLTRGQMLEVMGEDYIRTARAKGLSERRVVWKHGMRATLTPLVSQLGADVALLLGGAIVIEQVYGLQGVGALAVQAVANLDRPIIIGVVLLGGFFIVIANILVDVVYVLLDPRVR